MIELIVFMCVIGGGTLWWNKREARRLGIPWNEYLKLAKEKKLNTLKNPPRI